jgi:hypothetical protein
MLHQRREVKIARCEFTRRANHGDEWSLDVRIVEAHRP